MPTCVLQGTRVLVGPTGRKEMVRVRYIGEASKGGGVEKKHISACEALFLLYSFRCSVECHVLSVASDLIYCLF